MPKTTTQPILMKQVPCPFCSLLCDDLTVKNNAGELSVIDNTCTRLLQHIARIKTTATPQIEGQPATLSDAIAAAARILKKASAPLFAGLGTDVAGMRAALALAEKSRAYMDHMHGNALTATALTLQHTGSITTTLAELKNRADLVVFLGTDAMQYPRFFERIIWPRHALDKKRSTGRDIIYVGERLNARAGHSPDGRRPLLFKCAQNNLLEIVGALRALLTGKTLTPPTIGGIKKKQLMALATRLQQAKYGVLVWAPTELPVNHVELISHHITGMLQTLTKTTRFSGLPLGGNDGGITATQVSTWQSGYPLRINFQSGAPVYDPYQYNTNDLLHGQVVDALLWISSLPTDRQMPQHNTPTINLSTAHTKPSANCNVYIPIGTPGVDHAGQMLRTDGVVSLRLKKLRTSPYPSVANVLQQIHAKL